MATDQRVVAIGETGLDSDRMFSPWDAQLENLRRNLALALATGKPAILHCRSKERRARCPGRPARGAAPGRLRCPRRPLRGATACGHPFLFRSARLRAGRHRPRSCGQLLRARLPARRGGIGRGRTAGAIEPPAGRDRLAVPHPTRRPEGARRAGGRRDHGALGRRATRRGHRGAGRPSDRRLRSDLPTAPSQATPPGGRAVVDSQAMTACPKLRPGAAGRFPFCPFCGVSMTPPSPSRQERKVVTRSSCDLVGFTARAERFDPKRCAASSPRTTRTSGASSSGLAVRSRSSSAMLSWPCSGRPRARG